MKYPNSLIFHQFELLYILYHINAHCMIVSETGNVKLCGVRCYQNVILRGLQSEHFGREMAFCDSVAAKNTMYSLLTVHRNLACKERQTL